jgi:four helix bundle protein
MPTIKSFEEIEAWQLSRDLAKEIYALTQTGFFAKDYSLRDQINKACGSIMDNIAEGFERGGNREFIQFLSVAKGSAGEVRSQLYRSFDHNHITEIQLNDLKAKSILISKKINGLMNYLLDSDIKGMKFQETSYAYENPTKTNI